MRTSQSIQRDFIRNQRVVIYFFHIIDYRIVQPSVEGQKNRLLPSLFLFKFPNPFFPDFISHKSIYIYSLKPMMTASKCTFACPIGSGNWETFIDLCTAKRMQHAIGGAQLSAFSRGVPFFSFVFDHGVLESRVGGLMKSHFLLPLRLELDTGCCE